MNDKNKKHDLGRGPSWQSCMNNFLDGRLAVNQICQEPVTPTLASAGRWILMCVPTLLASAATWSVAVAIAM